MISWFCIRARLCKSTPNLPTTASPNALFAKPSLPVIANGDIRTATAGLHILEETGAAGLMLGRGAIAGPLLSECLRQRKTKEPTGAAMAGMLHRYLHDLLTRYSQLFCDEKQILDKTKNVVAFIDAPAFTRQVSEMKRAKSLATLTTLIEAIK